MQYPLALLGSVHVLTLHGCVPMLITVRLIDTDNKVVTPGVPGICPSMPDAATLNTRKDAGSWAWY
jgi:hypothetical protein